MSNAATLAFSHTNPQASTTLSTPAAAQNQLQTSITTAQQGPHDTIQSNNTYPHQITGTGGPTATAPFLRDFSLVAEAAKRAQVAIVTRDLEGVSL
ncbi:hypothetical protein BJX70DRAFT_373648 [Aspergillus crustosus]